MDLVHQSELDEKAVRDAAWLALVFAQRCEWPEISDQLVAIIAAIDRRRTLPTEADTCVHA
jgi:hypothetical protein